jgi:hypothetical protein
MKFTGYFQHTRQRPDRADIKPEWIEFVFYHPDFEQTQPDGRIRRWAYINEAEKYLRIVILEDKETIHNAFFDRSYLDIKNKSDENNIL